MAICIECGSTAKSLTRRRCGTCYKRHVAVLKKAGTFKPLIRSRDDRPTIVRVLSATVAGPGGCVLYTGELHRGYGLVTQPGSKSRARTHRVTYQHFIGPIPAGLHLDHRCHTEDLTCLGGPQCLHRRCVNPHHLEPVTPAENNRRSRGSEARKTHCPQGHPYNETNTRIENDGSRRCRRCASVKRVGARKRQRDRERLAASVHVWLIYRLLDALRVTDPVAAEQTVADLSEELASGAANQPPEFSLTGDSLPLWQALFSATGRVPI